MAQMKHAPIISGIAFSLAFALPAIPSISEAATSSYRSTSSRASSSKLSLRKLPSRITRTVKPKTRTIYRTKRVTKTDTGIGAGQAAIGGASAAIIAAEVIDELGDMQEVAHRVDQATFPVSEGKQAGVLVCERLEGNECWQRGEGFFAPRKAIDLQEWVQERSGKDDARVIGIQPFPHPSDESAVRGYIHYEYQ